MNRAFQSRWAAQLQEFVNFRKTYFASRWPESKLRGFDAFAAEHFHTPLSEVIDLWLQRNPSRHPGTRSIDLIAIRQFCLYRRRFDPRGFVPELIRPALAAKPRFKATILSPQQVKLLLRTINALRGPPLRRARLRALFLTLYCTGLRLGEALRLRLRDVDLKRAYFRIGPSKGRIRLVPFGKDLAKELRTWLRLREQAGFSLMPQTPFFEREDGHADNLWNAGMRFNTLFRRCGLKPKRGSGRKGLRVHDLRHTYCVHRLQRWYRAGLKPGPLLPWLSAYVGHVDLLGTQCYLTATPETLRIASRQFRRSVGFDPAAP
jgi:integrase/recombinase XerD